MRATSYQAEKSIQQLLGFTRPSYSETDAEEECENIAVVEVDLEYPAETDMNAESEVNLDPESRPSMLTAGPLVSADSFVSSIASSARSLRFKLGRWFGVLPQDHHAAVNDGIPAHFSGGSALRTNRHSCNEHDPRDNVTFEVLDLFDPDTPQAAQLSTSLYGEVVDSEGGDPLITDYHAALMAYRRYIAKEKVYKRRRRQLRRNQTDESDGHQSESTAVRSVAPSNGQKGALAEDVKLQLRSLPTFTPRFIPAITMIQLVVMCAMLFDSYARKDFARVGLAAGQTPCTSQPGGVPTCPLNFRGLLDTSATQVEPSNMWIGPDATYLIKFGGHYAPCMRQDHKLRGETSRIRIKECGTTVEQCDDPTVAGGQGYSCCGYEARAYGMTSNTTCRTAGGVWLDDRGRHRQCNIALESVFLRPCCIGNQGECQLYTESQCDFYEGVYHTDKQLCSEVACLSGTCTSILDPTKIPAAEEENRNDVADPNQWWRFIWPIFMHAGVIHYVLCMLIQWSVGCQIERTAGWLRVLLIYFVAGIGGYVVSGVVDPFGVTCGSDPAILGLLAVLYVELFQSWRMVQGPWLELGKLMVVFGLALLVGTFPFVDNWAHVGGFAFGVLASIIFLPYITFGKWDHRRKRVLLYISGPLLLVFFLTMLITFYLAQDAGCEWCEALSCVQYTENIQCN